VVDLDVSYLCTFLNVDRVLLLGSAADLHPPVAPRDIDLLVVSRDFRGMSLHQRRSLVLRCFPALNVDPVCLTPDGFERLRKEPSYLGRSLLAGGRTFVLRYAPDS